MVTSLLFATVTLASANAAPAMPLQDEPTVRVWTNKGDVVKTGDRVRVYVETVDDGYLLVLHAEPDGRIRFLYPLDPFRDNFVRGGRKVEIRGRGDREALRIFHDGGFGTIYAAYFRDPFEFREFIFGDHWDYRALEKYRLDDERDPETELTAVTQHVAGQTFFEYDLVHYGVGTAVASGGGGGTSMAVSVGGGWGGWGVGVGWGWGGWGPSFGVSVGWGYPYHHRYSHLYNCDPFWYNSWTCGSWYRAAWYAPYPYWGSYYYRPYYNRPYYSSPSHYYATPYASAYGGYGYGRGQSGLYASKYTFKPNQSRTSGLGLRNRNVTNRVATTDRRSVSSQTVDGRRVSPVATTTRRQVSQTSNASARQARPSGWGISDGRRTVTPVRTTRTSVEPDRRTVRTTTEVDRRVNPQTNTTRRTTATSNGGKRAVTTPRRATSSDRASSTRQSVDRSSVRRATAPGRTESTARRESQRPTRTTVQTQRRPNRSATSRPQTRSRSTSRAQPSRSVRTQTTRSVQPSRSVSRSPTGGISRGRAPARTARPTVRSAPRSSPSRRSAPTRRPRPND